MGIVQLIEAIVFSPSKHASNQNGEGGKGKECIRSLLYYPPT